MKPTLTPHQFVDTWANVYLKESSAYVTHFDDLCTLVGHPKPVHMDKTSPSLREGRRPTTHAPARTAGEQSPAENDIASQRPVREAGARMAKALAMTPLSQACALEDVIAQAAKELNDLRENWLNPYKDQPAGLDVTLKKRTLTNLYNENPTWLQNAHRKLDEAVFAAYGWPSNLSDDDILARLLELNLKRAGQS